MTTEEAVARLRSATENGRLFDAFDTDVIRTVLAALDERTKRADGLSKAACICPRCEGTGRHRRLGALETDCAVCVGLGALCLGWPPNGNVIGEEMDAALARLDGAEGGAT